ncbi:glycosyltransferase family 2 protein [Colwellia sp. RSH04]|nr:glycosyltransferase family 2 protein [Colwellia sp. RSH04]
MPAMNEGATIFDMVSSVVALGYQIIVVDDASSDNTVKEAKRAGAKVLCNIQNLGAWKATQTGLRYAESLGFHIVITMDADGQHDPKNIPLLVSQYAKGADVVIGNCTERGSLGRHVAWTFFKRLNRLNVSDITSGFRLYNEVALSCLSSRQATMLEYQCIGVLIMMRNLKLNIVEASVPMNKRESGISRIFHSWMAVGYYLAYSSLLSFAKAFPTNKDKYKNRVTRFKNID